MDAEDACAAHLLQLNELTEIVRAARGDEGLIQLRLPEYLTSRKLKHCPLQDPVMPARVALLGSGIFARRQHAPAIEACPDLELVAVYSRSLKSASSLIQDLGLKGVEAYSDDGAAPLADLLARTDVDAVIVALPIVQQSAIVKQCLTAGKHVLSEKPVAKDVATAEALISAYESSLGLGRWIIAEQFAYDLGFQRAAQVIAEGNIGDIRSFHLASHRFVAEDNQYFNTPWRKEPEYQGGFLLDGGVHLFAGLRKLFGSIAWPPKSLRAFAHLTHPRLAPLDTLHAILSLTDTVRGTVAISYGSEVDVDPSRPLVTVYGSAGTLEVLQGAQWTFRTRRSGNELVPEEETFEVRGVREEVDAFARAIVTGEWASCEERTGPCKALVDLAMVEACISSAERAES